MKKSSFDVSEAEKNNKAIKPIFVIILLHTLPTNRNNYYHMFSYDFPLIFLSKMAQDASRPVGPDFEFMSKLIVNHPLRIQQGLRIRSALHP